MSYQTIEVITHDMWVSTDKLTLVRMDDISGIKQTFVIGDSGPQPILTFYMKSGKYLVAEGETLEQFMEDMGFKIVEKKNP